MTSDHAFGSDQLSPDLVRSATFDDVDGRYDAAQVRTFLDRIASSLEVYQSTDTASALRAEFARNADIATQVLDAGQSAAEQLRRQAAEEAKRILDEARDATIGLRETVNAEIEQARTQVEAMRGTFIQDLRDLYDRIGASLYRFERAAEESAVAPIAEPQRSAPVPTPAEERTPEPVAATTPADAPAVVAESSALPPADVPELPEGAKPPAWQQLPAAAWSAADEPADTPGSVVDAPAPAEDPFEVVEDEPLAPGEPLVDLREMGAETPPSEAALEAENPVPDSQPEQVLEPISDLDGGSWLDSPADVPPVAPQADPAAGVPGSWLDAGEAAAPATDPAAADVAHDDALAEALIAGDAPAPIGAPILDPPEAAAAPFVDASADSLELRGTILEMSAAGHSREAIATFLRDQLNVPMPEPFIKATLGDE